MTAERWQKIKDVFLGALTHEGAERERFVREVCGQDSELLDAVHDMLAEHERDSGPLASPVCLDEDVRREVESLLRGRDAPGACTAAWPVPETLHAGARLGPYEILDRVGAGGMGTVHRARDTRVDRFVALKVCKGHVSGRFEREARAIAALNHPHICTLYDLGRQDGVDYLVMEFVEGETLAERLAKGRLPLELATRYAVEIADALAAAHARGIVHRDLKPGNIMVTKTGVKVLDFGLAKVRRAGVPSAGDEVVTQPGTIAGTPQYMSPEQVQGKDVDARSDIFSFGLVLYQMLSGRRAFEGENAASLMAAILEREPPPLEPPGLNRVVMACLAKDPGERVQTARDLKRLVEWTVAGGVAAPPPPSRSRWWIPWAAAAIFSALIFLLWRAGPSEAGLTRHVLTIVPPSDSPLPPVGNQASAPEISPDGASVMYRAPGGVWMRRLDSLDPELVRGSQVITNAPFWSSDSKSVAFDNGLELYRVRIPDGAPEVVTRLPGVTRGGTWSDDGAILVVSLGRLYAVPASGGELKAVELPGMKAGVYRFPQFLPGSQDFLVLFVPDDAEECEVYLATLRDGKAINPMLLLKNDTAAVYTPAGGGRVLFVRNDNLYSRRLGRTRRKVEGDAELIQQGVASVPGVSVNRATFSVSRTGVVAWRPGKAALNQVTIFDRAGKEIGQAGPPTGIQSLSLSPDESRLLGYSGNGSWMLEPGQSGRLSLGKGWNWALWSPDGSRLLGSRHSGLGERAVSGGEIHELGGDPGDLLEDISPDGRQVLTVRGGGLRSMRLQQPSQGFAETPVIQPGEPVSGAGFSPDGSWIVYSENRRRVNYVQPFPGPGLRTQIASVGGKSVWRKDGKEIVIFDGSGIWSVPVSGTATGARFGTPELLFSGLRQPIGSNGSTRPLAVSRDGSRFYLPVPVEQKDSGVIHVGVGWVK